MMPRLLIRMRLARNDKSNMVIATVDMQSVLQIPCSEVTTLYSLYYSRGSSEIGTSLYKWLTRLPDSVGEVIIYSDNCGGQNRNRHMAALLLYAVQMTKLKIINKKILERGHVYIWKSMACMH